MATPPSFSCGYASTGASSEVSSHLALVTSYTTEAFTAALEATAQLENVEIPSISLNVDLDNVPDAKTSGPPRPPDLGEIELTPELYDITQFNPGSDPAPIGFTLKPERPPDAPGPSPVDEPDFTEVTIAPVPAVDFSEEPDDFVALPTPELGDLLAINIPPVPAIEDVTFEGVRPSDIVGAPSNTFSFDEDDYSSEVLDATRAKILEIYDSGTGLPAAVAAALRNRAYEEVDKTAATARQAVDEAWGSRGFNLPPGMLIAARRQVELEVMRERNKLSRDIYVKEVDTQIDMLKTAMATSVTLEDVLIRLHISVQERRLTAARTAVELAISLFNARIAQANAENALYLADAQVYEARLRGEQLILERWKTQIEGEALKGQINEQTVKIFSERFRALEVNAQVYRAVIDGFKAKTDAKRGIIDAYTAYVNGQRAVVEINTAKAQVFAERIRAEGLKQENYKIRAETYGTAVQAWNVESQAEIERYKAEIQRIEVEARSYMALLERQKLLLDVERTRISAVSSENQALVGMYGIASQASIAENEAKIRRCLALLEEAKAKAQLALQNGQINIENGMNAANIILRAKETAAQVYSNMTASFASAINVNASISDSASSSQSCSQSTNFSTTFE